MKQCRVEIRIIAILTVALIALTFNACTKPQTEKMTLKADAVTIEYGTAVTSNIGIYLDNTAEYLADVQITGIPENEADNAYPAVGEYTLTFCKGEESKTVKLTVRDTVSPQFADLQPQYEVEYGTKLDATLITATDKSKVTVSLDDSTVDYQTSGTYTATVTATDAHGNTTEKTLQIVVKEKFATEGPSIEEPTQTPATESPSGEKPTQTPAIEGPSGEEPTQTPATEGPSGEKPTQTPVEDNKDDETPGFSIENTKASQIYSKILVVHTPNSTTSKGVFDYYLNTGGTWTKEMSVTCYVGSSGIGTASENSKKTPAGLYTFTMLFGINADPGTILPYKQLDGNDYWCGESNYNQFVDEDVEAHNCGKANDEHLVSYSNAYKYVAAFNYNPENIEGKGFAFFLHNMSGKTYTAGCIAIPIDDMRIIEQIIDNDTCIIIDTDTNLGKY